MHEWKNEGGMKNDRAIIENEKFADAEDHNCIPTNGGSLITSDPKVFAAVKFLIVTAMSRLANGLLIREVRTKKQKTKESLAEARDPAE